MFTRNPLLWAVAVVVLINVLSKHVWIGVVGGAVVFVPVVVSTWRSRKLDRELALLGLKVRK